MAWLNLLFSVYGFDINNGFKKALPRQKLAPNAVSGKHPGQAAAPGTPWRRLAYRIITTTSAWKKFTSV
jgi:hypothetical protein